MRTTSGRKILILGAAIAAGLNSCDKADKQAEKEAREEVKPPERTAPAQSATSAAPAAKEPEPLAHLQSAYADVEVESGSFFSRRYPVKSERSKITLPEEEDSARRPVFRSMVQQLLGDETADPSRSSDGVLSVADPATGKPLRYFLQNGRWRPESRSDDGWGETPQKIVPAAEPSAPVRAKFKKQERAEPGFEGEQVEVAVPIRGDLEKFVSQKNRVDVIWIHTSASGSSSAEPIIRFAKAIAVSKQAGAAGRSSVTLLLEPAEAEKVRKAEEIGKIELVRVPCNAACEKAEREKAKGVRSARAKHRENEWVQPESAPMSRFFPDFSSRSYLRAREVILAGGVPPAADIRVEEFLNYASTAGTTPFSAAFYLQFEAAPSPFHSGRLVLRIFVQAKPADSASSTAAAPDPEVFLQFNPAIISAYRLVGYDTRTASDWEIGTEQHAPDMRPGDRAVFLYELLPAEKDLPAAGRQDEELGFFELRYTDPATNKRRAVQQAVLIRNIRPLFAETSSDFRLSCSAAYLAQALHRSRYAVGFTMQDVLDVARSAAGFADAERQAELVRLAELLAPQGLAGGEGNPTPAF